MELPGELPELGGLRLKFSYEHKERMHTTHTIKYHARDDNGTELKNGRRNVHAEKSVSSFHI